MPFFSTWLRVDLVLNRRDWIFTVEVYDSFPFRMITIMIIIKQVIIVKIIIRTIITIVFNLSFCFFLVNLLADIVVCEGRKSEDGGAIIAVGSNADSLKSGISCKEGLQTGCTIVYVNYCLVVFACQFVMTAIIFRVFMAMQRGI